MACELEIIFTDDPGITKLLTRVIIGKAGERGVTWADKLMIISLDLELLIF